MPASPTPASNVTTTADPSSLATFGALVRAIVKVPNPQQKSTSGEPGEARLAKCICAWLDERKIKYTVDLEWGVHAVLTGPEGPGDKPGVLLGAHMDSDHLRIADLAGVDLIKDGTALSCKGQCGLDDKTGIAIILSVLERMQYMVTTGAWQVHALFTIGEESGQKGAIRAPIPQLLAGRVRYGIVVDRQSKGSGCPRGGTRHAVNAYKGVSLLEPKDSGLELVQLLNAAFQAVEPDLAKQSGGKLPMVESPNCADCIELRGRWDAEVIGPTLMRNPSTHEYNKDLEDALQTYAAATRDLLRKMKGCKADERASSMNAPPRRTRYDAMKDVYDEIHVGKAGDPTPPERQRLSFSCVNLSYDYDDAWNECDLNELDATARLVLHVCASVATAK